MTSAADDRHDKRPLDTNDSFRPQPPPQATPSPTLSPIGTVGTRQTERNRQAALHNAEYYRRMIAQEARRQELVKGKGLKQEFDLAR